MFNAVDTRNIVWLLLLRVNTCGMPPTVNTNLCGSETKDVANSCLLRFQKSTILTERSAYYGEESVRGVGVS